MGASRVRDQARSNIYNILLSEVIHDRQGRFRAPAQTQRQTLLRPDTMLHERSTQSTPSGNDGTDTARLRHGIT